MRSELKEWGRKGNCNSIYLPREMAVWPQSKNELTSINIARLSEWLVSAWMMQFIEESVSYDRNPRESTVIRGRVGVGADYVFSFRHNEFEF